ncbi:MAG: hypothetical protein MZV65_39330, partial [Chromatiales bacterium]|nr:hypothetical protein [Chromatiales bacterium]
KLAFALPCAPCKFMGLSMAILLGGETAWRVRRVGDLVLSYQWLDGEPCLFVYPARARRGAGALAVPLASAHQWAGADGYPALDHAIPTATRGAQMMGMFPDSWTVRRIVEAVVDGLPDLLEMPPEPPSLAKPAPSVGEMTIKIDGQTVAEHEVPA